MGSSTGRSDRKPVVRKRSSWASLAMRCARPCEQVQGGVLCTAAEQTEQAALVQLQQHPAGKAPCGKAGVALHGVIALRMGHNGHKAALRDGLERPQQHGAGQSKVKFYEQIP